MKKKKYRESEVYKAWEDSDFEEAFDGFSYLARTGNCDAMNNLGYFYDCGIGVEKSVNKALYWYRKSFRCGFAAAAANVATIYKDMDNKALALRWYRKAARLQDGESELEIAKMLLSDVGAVRSRNLAIKALSKAIESSSICPASREEASLILEKLEGQRDRSD